MSEQKPVGEKRVTPGDVVRGVGIQNSDGPSGDAPIDAALREVMKATAAFLESPDGWAVRDQERGANNAAEGSTASIEERAAGLEDDSDPGDAASAAAVLQSGRSLHEVLQRRLDEAAE